MNSNGLVFVGTFISSHLIHIIISFTTSSHFLLQLPIYPYLYTYNYLYFNTNIKKELDKIVILHTLIYYTYNFLSLSIISHHFFSLFHSHTPLSLSLSNTNTPLSLSLSHTHYLLCILYNLY